MILTNSETGTRTRILNIGDVAERTGLSLRTIYQEVSDDHFPRPIQLTARRVGWVESEVEDWINSRIALRDGR